MTLDFEAFRRDIAKSDTFRYMGKIEKIVGMTIEARLLLWRQPGPKPEVR